jgi:hypothetical protein
MTGFPLPEDFNSNPERLLRKARASKVTPPLVFKPPEEDPATQAPVLMAEKSLREYSVPSTVVLGPQGDIGNVGFELKTSLINMV